MRKTNKIIFFLTLLIASFLGLSAPSHATVCNSPCPNPCSPSQTICEGTNCTTYCGTSRTAVRTYVSPGVSFSYFGSNGSVSFSESYVGYYSPGLSITLGDVFHRPPRYPYVAKPRPSVVHAVHPVGHHPNVGPKNPPKKPVSVNKPPQKPSHGAGSPPKKH